MGRKHHGLECLSITFIRHGTNRTLMVDRGGDICGASKPGDKQLGCEESEK
jgi:hypothetical protein